MEFLTFSMVYAMLQTHQDLLQRYGPGNLVSQPINTKKPHYRERVMTALGELLIRVGTWLKEHSYRRLASDEASAPTFLIVL